MVSREFCRTIPKVELHVHLEGSIRPETLLKLAQRNHVELPAQNVRDLREWYRFRNFPHFVQTYITISKCIKSAEDLELVAREFLQGQAEQNILHSEVTYTASTIEQFNGIPWSDQIAALRRAISYGQDELGVSMSFIIDIVRGCPAERAMQVAEWAVDAHGNGVCALGLAGEEGACELSRYEEAFDYAHRHSLPIIPHAGETCGAESVAEAIRATEPVRIGHGVRSVENDKVLAKIRDRQIPLEVNPSSNVCLNVYPTLAAHPLPQLMDAGVYVTINSDDPPMFGTTLSDEFYRCAQQFGWSEEDIRGLCRNAANAALLPTADREALVTGMTTLVTQ